MFNINKFVLLVFSIYSFSNCNARWIEGVSNDDVIKIASIGYLGISAGIAAVTISAQKSRGLHKKSKKAHFSEIFLSLTTAFFCLRYCKNTINTIIQNNKNQKNTMH